MIADKIVRQLVTKSDPPVRHRLDQPFGGIHIPFMQLLKKAQITKNASILIESNCTALLVREDIERRDREVEDSGAVGEQNVERRESGLVVSEEDLRVRGVAGEEEFHALADIADESEIVAGFAVAVCRGLFDLVGFWTAEKGVRGV
jgi:hypothetical protein